VYDLEAGDFVKADKYDYMTLTTGYDYREPTEEEIQTLSELFDKVFPIPAERDLYLTILATGFYGMTLEKFVLANGGGRNGKGFTNELSECMFGNYAYTCSNSVLLSPLKGGAQQEVANMNHKRIIFYREPDTDCHKKLNVSTIKELTGGSKINARGIYERNTNTMLKGTNILECNEKPKMSGKSDEAISMRLIDVGFRSTFTKIKANVNENKFIFEGNDEVKSERFREKHKFAFFKILTEYWKKYQQANKNIDAFIPDNIRERGQKYLKGSSELYSWFDEMYELTSEEDKEFVKLADVYNTFKQSDTYLNYRKAEKRELNKEKFIEEISHNLFLKSSYIERYTFYNKEGKRVEARNVLMNYKVKPAEESQENSEDMEEE
jgi:phage/plasmid-associated DNA primase